MSSASTRWRSTTPRSRKRVRGGRASKYAKKKRVPTGPAAEPAEERFLVWQFGKLDHSGPFCCSNLALPEVPVLEKELAEFQSEPIGSLRRKRWLKFIEVQDMAREAQGRLGEISQAQEDGLWQLHLAHDKWRVWGYFDTPHFTFLWWDGDHAVATGRSRHRST
jgi:hypothetical protein